MDDWQKEILRKHRSPFVNTLKVNDEFLDLLFASNYLTENDIEEIEVSSSGGGSDEGCGSDCNSGYGRSGSMGSSDNSNSNRMATVTLVTVVTLVVVVAVKWIFVFLSLA